MKSQTVKNVGLLVLLNAIGFTIAVIVPWSKLSESGAFELKMDVTIPFNQMYAYRFIGHISGEYAVSSPVEINAFSCDPFSLNEAKSTPATVVEQVLRCKGLEMVKEKDIQKFRLKTNGVVSGLPDVVLVSRQPFSVKYTPDPWGFEIGMWLTVYGVIILGFCFFFNWFFYGVLFK